jgi:hypothetical protein
MPRGVRKNAVTTATENNATTQSAETHDQDQPVIKKKGTRPGWKPAGQLPKLKAPPGWTAKWASSDAAKLSKLRAEGWEFMKESDNKGDKIVKVDVLDGSSLIGEIRYRDMVAMMLPNELKEARDDWLRQENKDAMRNILKQTDETFKEHGVQTYAPTGQDGRIVID